MDVAGDARHGQSPLVSHRWIQGDPGSAVGICWVGPMTTMLRLCQSRMACLCARPQRGVSGRQAIDHVDWEANEFVGQHAAAAQSWSAVVVIADGDAGAGSNVVVGLEIEITDCPGVMMALQIAAHLVVTVAEAVGKEAAFRVEQQARRLDGTAGDDDEIGKLLLQMAVAFEIGDPAGSSVVVGKNLLHHALGAQFAIACSESNGNHRVLRPVLRIHFARESTAPAASHARAAAVVGNAVAGHGNVERMQAKAFCRRLQDSKLTAWRHWRHGQRTPARAMKW